jgi:hypothetical protein
MILASSPMLLAAEYQGFARNLILLVYGGLLLLLAVRSLRAQRLKERYVLLLVFTGLPFLGLAIWPDALALAAQWLGMPYHTLMVLCLAAFLILVIFELLSIVSVQEQRIATLAQHVGLLMQEKRSATDNCDDDTTPSTP